MLSPPKCYAALLFWAATALASGAVPFSAPPPCPGCLFSSPQAAWLYAGPSPTWGDAHLVGDATAWRPPTLNTNDIGFGAPIQHTRGADGVTAVNDFNYGPGWRHDRVLVPNPPGNRWTPSCGWRPPAVFGTTVCYGAYDGKDFIIDDTTGNFYDMDQLYVDAAGHPINFGVNGYASGPCGGPGQHDCGLRGVFAGNLATSSPTLGGSTAAGIVSGAGDILPGELECATCLNHAIQVVAPSELVNRVVCHAFPTSGHGDGQGALPRAPLCEGGFLLWTGDWRRLDPATHSTAVIALARALQFYGGFITDQSGGASLGFYSDYDAPPAMAGAQDLLHGLEIFYGGASLQ